MQKPVDAMADQENEDLYPCIGVCMADPSSGLCQGCGRPLAEPESPEPDDDGAESANTPRPIGGA